MRRRFGADHVEINTVEQWAKAYLHEPTLIDFPKFVAAAETASFPTLTIQLEVEGTVRESATGLRLEVTGTDQSFPIEAGFLGPGETGRIHGDVVDFEGTPRLGQLPTGVSAAEADLP